MTYISCRDWDMPYLSFAIVSCFCTSFLHSVRPVLFDLFSVCNSSITGSFISACLSVLSINTVYYLISYLIRFACIELFLLYFVSFFASSARFAGVCVFVCVWYPLDVVDCFFFCFFFHVVLACSHLFNELLRSFVFILAPSLFLEFVKSDLVIGKKQYNF